MSETRKRQVLVISTIIIMAIVVGVWLSYFNSVVMGGAGTTGGASSASVQSSVSSTPAPASSAAPAWSGIWTRIKDGMSSIGRMFSGPSQYTIQPQQ